LDLQAISSVPHLLRLEANILPASHHLVAVHIGSDPGHALLVAESAQITLGLLLLLGYPSIDFQLPLLHLASKGTVARLLLNTEAGNVLLAQSKSFVYAETAHAYIALDFIASHIYLVASKANFLLGVHAIPCGAGIDPCDLHFRGAWPFAEPCQHFRLVRRSVPVLLGHHCLCKRSRNGGWCCSGNTQPLPTCRTSLFCPVLYHALPGIEFSLTALLGCNPPFRVSCALWWNGQ